MATDWMADVSEVDLVFLTILEVQESRAKGMTGLQCILYPFLASTDVHTHVLTHTHKACIYTHADMYTNTHVHIHVHT